MKISTLLESSKRINNDEEFHFVVKEFMDGAYLSSDVAALIAEQPEQLSINDGRTPDKVYNVLLAGIADEVAFRFNLNKALWTKHDDYILKIPFFTTDNPEKRQIYLIQTPMFYRARNLFCGKVFSDLHPCISENT